MFSWTQPTTPSTPSCVLLKTHNMPSIREPLLSPISIEPHFSRRLLTFGEICGTHQYVDSTTWHNPPIYPTCWDKSQKTKNMQCGNLVVMYFGGRVTATPAFCRNANHLLRRAACLFGCRNAGPNSNSFVTSWSRSFIIAYWKEEMIWHKKKNQTHLCHIIDSMTQTSDPNRFGKKMSFRWLS